MNNLKKYDFLVIGLFFALLLAITPVLPLVDETSLEGSLPGPLAFLGWIGFMLSVPLAVIADAVKIPTNPNLVSWFTAIVYSFILAIIISKLKAGKVKRD